MCPRSELGFGRVFPSTWDLCQKNVKTWGGTRERMGQLEGEVSSLWSGVTETQNMKPSLKMIWGKMKTI